MRPRLAPQARTLGHSNPYEGRLSTLLPADIGREVGEIAVGQHECIHRHATITAVAVQFD